MIMVAVRTCKPKQQDHSLFLGDAMFTWTFIIRLLSAINTRSGISI